MYIIDASLRKFELKGRKNHHITLGYVLSHYLRTCKVAIRSENFVEENPTLGKTSHPFLASLVFHIKQRVLLVITICQNSTLFNFLLF